MSAGSSAASVTRCGSKPASASTSWQTCTVIASGSTADGCGLTTTGLPVTSEAKRPGQEFQVGNVLQPITSATPRGTTVNVFSIRIAATLPGFSQTARARRPGHLDPRIGDRLERTVERVGAAGLERHHERLARWCAGRRCASSKTRACSRSRISMQTPTRASGPASRQALIPDLAAASSASTRR